MEGRGLGESQETRRQYIQLMATVDCTQNPSIAVASIRSPKCTCSSCRTDESYY